METNNSNTCFNCEKTYPAFGFYCGGCLTQFKCKSCSSILEKGNVGCTFCGTPIDSNNISASNNSQNLNTFRLHETANDRIIEATFSDVVGKDLAGILKDSYSSARIGNLSNQKYIGNKSDEFIESNEIDNNFIDHKLIDSHITSNEDVVELKKETNQTFIPPTLLSIEIKKLPSTEVEWIIVYSYYASNYGTKVYQRKDILDMHIESQRKSPISKNLSANLQSAIRSGYINALKEGYYLGPEGVQKALEIIHRKTGSSKARSNNPQKKTNETSEGKVSKANNASNKSEVKSLKRITDLNLFPSNKESLKDFYGKFQLKSDFERILIFIFYLEEILKVSSITPSHVYTCYDSLDLRLPESLPQTIRNMKSRTGWIDKNSSGFVVTFKGRNYIKDKS